MQSEFIIKEKSVVIIKNKDISLNDFYETVSIYTIKYPSHIGYIIIDETENRIVKFDGSWWTYAQFLNDMKNHAKPEYTIIAVLTLVETSTNSSNIMFKTATPLPQRIFLLSNINTALVQNMPEEEFQKTSIFISTGLITYSVGENKNITASPKAFLTTLQATLGKDGFNDFSKKPREFITNPENKVTLPLNEKIVLYLPTLEDKEKENFIFIRATNGEPMKTLLNGMVVSDDLPLNPIKGIKDDNVISNCSSYQNETNPKIRNYNLFNHLINEFDLSTSYVSQLKREVFLSGKIEISDNLFPEKTAYDNDDDDILMSRYGY